ncbi:hypothetical protein R3P38DRAFT_2935299 [Favolaschia claudopus]|uniref:F-box domain-containing protein n=1 Tax=Favolaschia claudopus TaxID=2862362 RepID=A0AAW0BN57_9AGAR
MTSTRTKKALSDWFSNEVISEIIQAIPDRADVSAVCKTSKLFHSLGIPVLFQVVKLKNGSRIMAFVRTVSAKPDVSGFVRSLTTIDIGSIKSSRLQWLACLKSLTKLEDLSMTYFQFTPEDWDIFLSFTFPRLVHCKLDASYNERSKKSPMDFVARHSALESLSLNVWDPPKGPAPPQIPLLNLRRLQGPASLAQRITAPRLGEVRLEWESVHFEDVEPIFSTLKTMIPADNSFVFSNDGCWDNRLHDFLPCIANNVPHVKTLHLHLIDTDMWNSDTHIEWVAEQLPPLSKLEYLSIVMRGDEDDDHPYFLADEEDDLMAVETLGTACSSLQMCRLNDVVWRKENETWNQSSDDFDRLAGISWIER